MSLSDDPADFKLDRRRAPSAPADRTELDAFLAHLGRLEEGDDPDAVTYQWCLRDADRRRQEERYGVSIDREPLPPEHPST